MSVQLYRKRRSFQSCLVEKYLEMRNFKQEFSTARKTSEAVKQAGYTNYKPYIIEDMKFSNDIKEDIFENMQVFTLNDQKSKKQRVILYLHGGAWTLQPLSYHWKFMDEMAQALNAKIVAPIYPKIPHFSYKHAYPKILSLYKAILETVQSSKRTTIMGDSAGGNISLGLAHILKENDLPQPKDIILLSACVDMVLDNPHIPDYEAVDPMLSANGMEVITKLWADDRNSDDPIISPIYGNFTGLAKITHFIGTHESLYPDAIKLDKKLARQGITMNTFVYPKMNHVFVVMPIPEAKDAKQQIVDIIND